jgi:nucleoside-diphosphate kinase
MSKTFTIIKPVAMQNGLAGKIIDNIYEAGFTITAMRMTHITREQAMEFYKVHKDRPFYEGLVTFMSSAPVIVAQLEKENAVQDYRKLIGNTDPAKAEKGTIRQLYGTSMQANAVHGSDSDENAEIECSFFFKNN